MDLRCYGLTSPRYDNKISLQLTDIGDHYQEWDVDTLPWDAVTPVLPGEQHAEQLDQRLVEAIAARALPDAADVPRGAHPAALAFLYLYMTLAHGDARPTFNFAARSTMPVSAGLGSSASYSACIATALLLLHQRVRIPSLPPPTRPAGAHEPGHVHVSHHGRRALPPDFAEEANRWAFVAEKVLHGNPSGVDNAVAVFGGALAYTRPGFGRKSGMEQIQGFKSLRFLLTNSKVPRDTKKLVAGVAMKKAEEPEAVNKIMDAIQAISDEARRALADPELPRTSLLEALSVRTSCVQDYLTVY